MRRSFRLFTPLLAAGATVAVIVGAPVAAAAPNQAETNGGGAASNSQPNCVTLGATQNQCQTPGNAQVYDAPPQVDYFPYAGGAT